MSLKVITYFHPLSPASMEANLKLILAWRTAWLATGCTPVVVGESHARRHPQFEAYALAVSKLPNVNPPKYDECCFLRWAAVAVAAGNDVAAMADYDCFPSRHFDLKAILARAINPDKPTSYQTHVPCFVVGDAKAFNKACSVIARYKPDAKDVEGDKPHVSDQSVLDRTKGQGWYLPLDVVREYGETGDRDWRTAPVVHFSSGAMAKAGLRPKHEHIAGLLAEII